MNSTKKHIEQLTEEQKIWELLKEVHDPEVPVLSVIDLGIIRKVEIIHDVEKPPLRGLGVCITITPTYSGCPAMDVISMNIRIMLSTLGFKKIKIIQLLSPAWTT
ncbi:MAG TPA: iron-sulfur cluster assembly protein, partial [Chitinophagaceae bacterium]|nr:iron-sulfur cluster assembly protein [Chitinophagaceae bacterium]